MKIEYKKRLKWFLVGFFVACGLAIGANYFKVIDQGNLSILGMLIFGIAYFVGSYLIKQIELNNDSLIVTRIFGKTEVHLEDIASVKEETRMTLNPPSYSKVLCIHMKSGEEVIFGLHQLPPEVTNLLLNKV
jgi:hypothetical protein